MYSEFFKQSNDLLAIANFEGYFTELNPVWEKVFGFTVAELTSNPFLSFVHPDDIAKTSLEAAKLGQGGHNTIFFENRYRCKDGSYRLLQWQAVANLEKKQLYCIARDITNQVSTDKLMTLGEMTASMAHDILNPLTVVIGKIKKVKNQVDDLSKVELDRANNACLRIQNIIGSIKSLSRDGSKDPMESISVQKVLDETLQLVQHRFKDKNVPLEVSKSDSYILGRETEIIQVLVNLINNAFDASVLEEESWVKVNVVEHNNNIRFQIVDSGLGISKEIQDKILQPFFTTKGVGKGTGLGLSISKRIIDNHNGKLEITKQDGHTCFNIDIPVIISLKKVA